MVYAVHHVAGRIRIRNSAIKGNPAAAARYRDVVRCMPGVRAARTSVLTGSVVIEYDRSVIGGGKLLRLLAAQPVSKSSRRSQLADQLAERLGRVVVERLIERSAGALIAALI